MSLPTPVNKPMLSKNFWTFRFLPAAGLVLAGAVHAQPTAQTPVCLYEHHNYLGRSVCLQAGAANLPAGWNDLTSSVKVLAGSRVDLFQHYGFAGRMVTLTSDANRLNAFSFNDALSSYRVTAAAPAAACAAQTLTWTVGGSACWAEGRSVASGASLTLQDVTAPTTGAASFACSKGKWSLAGGLSCVSQQVAIPRPVSKMCDGTTGPATELPMPTAGVARSASLATDRQRVAIQCIADRKNPSGPKLNVLRSDQGTPLRAGTAWVWKPNETPAQESPPEFFEQMRQGGMNAVRVIAFDVWEAEAYGGQFLRNFDDPVFLNKLRTLLERTVNNCSRYGMYCILNAHNKIGSFNAAVNQKFWAVMAPYFANRTHVIFEQANEPWAGTGIEANYVFTETAALAALRSGYNDIRTAARNTHIMVLSPTGVNGWGYVDALAHVAGLFGQQPGPAIDWTNTSVSYHLYATDSQFGSPYAENLRNLHSRYAGWPSENNFPYSVSNATLGITDSWRSGSYVGEEYINQTTETLGLGWSMWNIEDAAQFTRNFPLLINDATAKGYLWTFDARVSGELTR